MTILAFINIYSPTLNSNNCSIIGDGITDWRGQWRVLLDSKLNDLHNDISMPKNYDI